ncbi:high mobility group B protein 15-like [Wolffia australiana]
MTKEEEGSPSPSPSPPRGAANGNGAEIVYPVAEAAYEAVVEDAGLFLKTLERLHSGMGTKFMVPRIGGRALDLHRFFVEVTLRGGLERAIKERKWREVIAVFNFPSTITSASYVLRKYYISLLKTYEQVYFFRDRASGLSSSVAAPSSASRTSSQGKVGRRSLHYSSVREASSVVGQITGKFDHGYLVTAKFGTEELVGVLYHPPRVLPEQRGLCFSPCHHSRKKSRKLIKDPSRPKSNRSGYNFFFAEQYAKLKSNHSGEESAITKQIGQLWNQLGMEEKEVYREKGVKDKERYLSEMVEYRKSSNGSQTR